MKKALKSTLEQGAEKISDDFSVSTKLEKDIEGTTLKKTGAKFFTNQQAKDCLMAAGALGGLFSAADKWFEGDKKGAALALGCGVASILCASGMSVAAFGVAGASIIAAAILKRKKEAQMVMQEEQLCNR